MQVLSAIAFSRTLTQIQGLLQDFPHLKYFQWQWPFRTECKHFKHCTRRLYISKLMAISSSQQCQWTDAIHVA